MIAHRVSRRQTANNFQAAVNPLCPTSNEVVILLSQQSWRCIRPSETELPEIKSSYHQHANSVRSNCFSLFPTTCLHTNSSQWILDLGGQTAIINVLSETAWRCFFTNKEVHSNFKVTFSGKRNSRFLYCKLPGLRSSPDASTRYAPELKTSHILLPSRSWN